MSLPIYIPEFVRLGITKVRESQFQTSVDTGSWLTIKNGSYTRRTWLFTGRQCVRVQRHLCRACAKSYSEQSPLLVRGSWYSRQVRRSAVDRWHN